MILDRLIESLTSAPRPHFVVATRRAVMRGTSGRARWWVEKKRWRERRGLVLGPNLNRLPAQNLPEKAPSPPRCRHSMNDDLVKNWAAGTQSRHGPYAKRPTV